MLRASGTRWIAAAAAAVFVSTAAAQPRLPLPISNDPAGFELIFDGKSLDGWDGDPDYWSVEDGVIVGRTTADKALERNTFLVWRGGMPGDFELKLEYRITNTNSGVQFRSQELPDVGKWVLKGYQADIDAANQHTGQVYEERGRGFLAVRGQLTYIGDGERPRILGSLGDKEALKDVIHPGWNQFHLIARGNVIVQILNGRVTSALIDDDLKNRSMAGLIGLQLHRGDPMKLEIKNVYLKRQ